MHRLAKETRDAILASPARLIEIVAALWSNDTLRVMARNIRVATLDVAAAAPQLGITKRRMP